MPRRKNEREFETNRLQQLFERYASAVVPVFTVDNAGDEHLGSAFHVGGGVFVTARHVGESQREISVSCRKTGANHLIELRNHPNNLIDVSVFVAPHLDTLPVVPLGGHLDDWISDEAFILNRVLVLGFPPIPLSSKPILVAARGDINAVVDLINAPHVHFVVSVVPRGGFSGGVVLSEWGFALGVITQSLVRNSLPAELGYLTVLSVEPILECLGHHRLMTPGLLEQWGDLFSSEGSST